MTDVITPRSTVAELRISDASPEHLFDLLEMLGRCSGATLFHRFHGITDGTAHVRHLVASSGHESLTAWSGGQCVGLATLAVAACGQELGVLIEDRWQRRGVGTSLVERLVASARRRGIDEVVADVLGDDGFILRVLRRIGPVRTTAKCGVYTARVSLHPDGASWATVR